MLKVNWSHEAELKAPETKSSSIVKTYALAKPPTSDSSSNIFSTGYLLQDICFRIFATGYLLQNICAISQFCPGWTTHHGQSRLLSKSMDTTHTAATSQPLKSQHKLWNKPTAIKSNIKTAITQVKFHTHNANNHTNSEKPKNNHKKTSSSNLKFQYQHKTMTIKSSSNKTTKSKN